MFLTSKRTMNLQVNGQVIRTPVDHPFFVLGNGWLEASDLQVDDQVHTQQGGTFVVEALGAAGEEEVICNFGEHPLLDQALADYSATHPISGFVAGTLIQTAKGPVPIEQLRPGDLIVTRSDIDPSQPEAQTQGGACGAGLPLRPVQEVFARAEPIWTVFMVDAPLWELQVGGQVTQTCGAHPFYVCGKGWLPLWQVRPGDLLLSDSGEAVPVEEVIAPPGWWERN